MTFLSSDSSSGSSSDSGAFILEGATVGSSMSSRKSAQESVFYRLVEAVGNKVSRQGQAFTLILSGEVSQFIRFNQAKVRQAGEVCDGQIKLTLMDNERITAAHLPFIGQFDTDWSALQQTIEVLQTDLPQVSVDPYLVLPKASSASRSQEVRAGQLLDPSLVADTLLREVQNLDFSGLYAGGLAYRAYGDSAGNCHWFETPSFTLDYSLFGDRAGQAVKGTLAGRRWNRADYLQSIRSAQHQLDLLKKPVKAVPKGAYRTYLAPTAAADIIDTIIWGGGLGEADLRQGNTAFGHLEKGNAVLSAQFSLSEDFQKTDVPRFNGRGILAPTRLAIIQAGRWANALVSDRSAKEYGKADNAANATETMRAPSVAPGTLPTDQILTQLGTGLYLSNLHYLNWSDLTAGRMTGMTRYACFWVEDGEMVAPIENLRFDDNLYRFLGEGLVDLTDRPVFAPAVDTYERRSLGGIWTPGMLIDQFRYTL